MPGYAWTCHVCGGTSPAGAESCRVCAAPAVLSGREVDERRRARAGLPREPAFLIEPKRLGWLFVGGYGLLVALTLVFVATVGGDMSALLLVLPALPWPLVGHLLYREAGLGIGTFGGLALNAVLAYAAGYRIGKARSRRRTRAEHP